MRENAAGTEVLGRGRFRVRVRVRYCPWCSVNAGACGSGRRRRGFRRWERGRRRRRVRWSPASTTWRDEQES